MKHVQDEGCQELIIFSQARAMLEKAMTMDDIKDLHDRAEALRMYAKKQQDSAAIEQQCAEVKIRCERKMGELLGEMEKNKGAAVPTRLHDATTLADLGIEKTQSHRYQRMAAIPESDFEEYLGDTTASGKVPTSAAVLRLARQFVPAKPRRQKPWNIENDVDAIHECISRLVDHWQTSADKLRITNTLRGLAVMLEPDEDVSQPPLNAHTQEKGSL